MVAMTEEERKRKARDYNRAYREKNREALQEKQRASYLANREKKIAYVKNYKLEKQEEVKQKRRERYYRDPEKARKDSRDYRRNNKEARAEKDREYREKNRDAVLAQKRKHYHANSERLLAEAKERKAENPEQHKAYRRLYYRENKENILPQQKAYYARNKGVILERTKSYRENLPESVRKKQQNDYQARREQEDPMYKLAKRLRTRMGHAFRQTRWKKAGRSHELLGTDWPTIKAHIERQFTEGMTWKNWAPKGWHIDHIVPLASARTPEEMEVLCHYTNLQPLWARDNLRKSNKTG